MQSRKDTDTPTHPDPDTPAVCDVWVLAARALRAIGPTVLHCAAREPRVETQLCSSND
jgi:hypothetical protein